MLSIICKLQIKWDNILFNIINKYILDNEILLNYYIFLNWESLNTYIYYKM